MSTHEREFFERLQALSLPAPTAKTEGTAAETILKKLEPETVAPFTVRSLFTHHETHPITIHFALIRAFGVEWIEWEPATLYREVQRIYETQISEHARAKMMVVKTIHAVTSPWKNWAVFEKVVQGLNGNIPLWSTMQKPTLAELYSGVDILSALRSEEFSPEVRSYMVAVCLDEGVELALPPLDFIQSELSGPYIHCLDCGRDRDAVDGDDGYCDFCSSRFSPEQGLSLKPHPEAVAKGLGKNTEVRLHHDPAAVEERWKLYLANEQQAKPDVVDQADGENLKTSAEVQVFKLKFARDYTNIRRRQLADQLTLLKKSWVRDAP